MCSLYNLYTELSNFISKFYSSSFFFLLLALDADRAGRCVHQAQGHPHSRRLRHHDERLSQVNLYCHGHWLSRAKLHCHWSWTLPTGLSYMNLMHRHLPFLSVTNYLTIGWSKTLYICTVMDLLQKQKCLWFFTKIPSKIRVKIER